MCVWVCAFVLVVIIVGDHRGWVISVVGAEAIFGFVYFELEFVRDDGYECVGVAGDKGSDFCGYRAVCVSRGVACGMDLFDVIVCEFDRGCKGRLASKHRAGAGCTCIRSSRERAAVSR